MKLQIGASIFLTWLLAAQSWSMPTINQSDTAGAVMNHNLQYMMIQQQAPWTFNNARGNDLVSPYERYWIYHDEDLQFDDAESMQGMLKDANGNVHITGPSFLKELKKK